MRILGVDTDLSEYIGDVMCISFIFYSLLNF